MLKGIPRIISPKLMKTLMEMGHGDEIIFADGNFPAAACAKRLIRSDGHLITELLKAIIPYFPLDKSVDHPVIVMSLLPGDKEPEVWGEYRGIIKKHNDSFADFEYVERFSFYERSKNAFAVVATSDQSFKGNMILKKGVVRD
ncbi:RbsD/FucU family protein [Paenibacillus solisilvae]|uniref:RbsD/FucU family protein n=1 Tax=Paenibacillus solisilvae TaxID=2486751 RepID=A0ABW0W6R6_9BACL